MAQTIEELINGIQPTDHASDRNLTAYQIQQNAAGGGGAAYDDTALQATIVASDDETQAKLDDLISIGELKNWMSEAGRVIDLTYVSSGNGVGEIETVNYKQAVGGLIAQLTLAYDADANLTSITRTV